MAVKLSGAEFKTFWLDDSYFPKEGAVEEECIYVNGAKDPLSCDLIDYPAQITDGDSVRLVGGYIVDYSDNSTTSLEPVLKKWLAQRDTEIIVLHVKKAHAAEVRLNLSVMDGVKVQ